MVNLQFCQDSFFHEETLKIEMPLFQTNFKVLGPHSLCQKTEESCVHFPILPFTIFPVRNFYTLK